ncbi:MMPL family protein [Planctomycetes bacterium CA13]|uniref:MMPL family protein n=1 Tax=Novipirellula herctigrandis TaxID=2527986 RepID=A0A5C5Z304_9BACT|nr:MMPL family protein [Planctomycetes bacterium CA13]
MNSPDSSASASSFGRWTRRTASFWVRHRIVMAVLGLMVFAVSFPVARHLSLDRRIASMFAPDDPTLLDYQLLQDLFGGNAVAMLVYRDDNLMSREGIDRSEAISQQVRVIPGVSGVLSTSVLDAAVQRIRPANFFSRSSKNPPLTHRDDIVARGIDLIFSGYTHSRDHSLAAVVATLDPKHPPETIRSLQQVADALPDQFDGKIGAGFLVGEPVLINDGFDLVERDGRKLATVTLVLLSIVVLITLMDFRFVFLTALVVVWSVVVTEAFTVLFGIHRSLVSTIMTAIVTVISVAAVLHLGVKFQNARARGLSQVEASERAISTLIVPIFWTCVTDAAGFAALGWSRILPVRQFGIMIAIASIAVFVSIAFFAAVTMMMPDLRFFGSLHRAQRRATIRISRYCIGLADWSVGHRKSLIAVSIVVMFASVYQTWQATPETSFLNNFRSDSPVVVAYNSVEHEFGGAGVWDVILPGPKKWSNGYFRQVIELQKKLRDVDADGAKLTKVLSMADVNYVVSLAPLLRMAPPSVRLSGMRITMPSFFAALLAGNDASDESSQVSSPKMLRIMLRSEEQLPAEQKIALIREVERVVAEHTSAQAWRDTIDLPNQIKPKVTGYYVMMSRLVAQLVGDQWRCLAVAGILVWLLLWIATGSIRLSLASLLPTILPAFVVLAVAGWLGGKINMGATMIAAVSIGLTIDGAVHLLLGYGRYRNRGHSIRRSVSHAAGNVGVPILLATGALVVGFSVLSTSEFIPTATFGILVAATLLLGTLVNLTLLPACVAAQRH